MVFDDIENFIKNGEQVILLTKGSSMYPFIVGERDSVELTPINRDDIKVGDIMLARIDNPTRHVVHRVIEIKSDIVTLMGDGNLYGTEQCHRDAIVARITSIIKPHRIIDPYSTRELLYAKIWGILCPFRRYIFAIRRRVKKLIGNA